MKPKALSALVLGAALLSFDAAADQGQLRYYQTSGDWFSAIFRSDNTDMPRIGTKGSDGTNLIMDFLENNTRYLIMIVIPKQGSQIGNVISPNPVRLPCELRIDLNPKFLPGCYFQDDNTVGYLNLLGSLNQRFIDESQGGNTLRIKLEVPGSEPMYTSYSLRGFTKAYYRAMSFSLSGSGSGYRDDSDYFR